MNPIALQRLSYKLRKIPLIPKLITLFNRLIFGCYLPYQIKLGKDFVVGYGGIGIVVHHRTIVGDNVHIDQNVTIGGTSKKIEVPKLGNNIYIGAGAVIIGPITIGDDVVIGANAVVNKDIPSNSLVVGVPAKVIKSGIKKEDYV